MASRTRGRLSVAAARAALGIAAAMACARFAADASSDAGAQRGAFALLGGTAKIASEAWTSGASGAAETLQIRQFRLGGRTPIVTYDVEMQKVIHLIVVRDDFATFAHLHPAFDPATGTFHQPLRRDRRHGYYVYADTTPPGAGQQVFRFTMEPGGNLGAGAAPQALARRAMASARRVSVPPYTVALARTVLEANRPQRIDLTILERGRPAGGLQTYLGAAAHAVFVNAATLAYVHVHPMPRNAGSEMRDDMSMGVARAGPLLRLDAPALPAGAYKLWIEFRGARGTVYTAPFTMLAR